MFGQLAEKFEAIFKTLRGHGKLSDSNIREALKEVRRALLEADVNYRVVKEFSAVLETKAIGQAVLQSITPGQQFIKIVHDELVHLLGNEVATLQMATYPPTVIMAVGLQGSGKTTFCGKLARQLKTRGQTSLLVAADVYRPAAIQQLQTLGEALGAPVFTEGKNPVEIAEKAVTRAREDVIDVVIIDTAGRLHIDHQLMAELVEMKKTLVPHEVLLVADAMTGQEAVNIAQKFHQAVGIDGVVLTKLDGDARGGAALSIRFVIGKPIKYVGIGEKLEDLELFYPERIASRILGMGDVVTLVEKAQATISEKQAKELEEKILKEKFSFEDFLEQLQQVKKMGPLANLIGLLPGVKASALQDLQVDEGALGKIEAIISSMTTYERRNPGVIDGSRRRRIALGSGTSPHEVNQLLKQFFAMQKMMKQMSKFSMRDIKKGMLPRLGL